MAEVLTITVQQPWAECIARAATDPAAKLIENRAYRSNHRGLIAIHAGVRTSTRGYQLGYVRRTLGLAPDGADARRSTEAAVRDLPRRVVVALAELVGCHPAAEGCCLPWGEPAYGGKPLYHLELAHVCRLAEPIPARGQISWWRSQIDDHIIAATTGATP